MCMIIFVTEETDNKKEKKMLPPLYIECPLNIEVLSLFFEFFFIVELYLWHLIEVCFIETHTSHNFNLFFIFAHGFVLGIPYIEYNKLTCNKKE